MQKKKILHFKDNSLPFFPHHVNRRKSYYSENGKAEIIMPDLMFLFFLTSTYKNTTHVQMKSFPKFYTRV